MITYSPQSPRSAAVAETLGAAFDLWCAPHRGVEERHAALTVAEASEHRHHDPSIPVVVVPARARAQGGVSGRIVLCGVEDEGDAPAAATAGAIAEAVGVRLVLAHVIPPPAAVAPGRLGPRLDRGLTVEDRTLARATLDSVARAAGLERPSTRTRRVLRGTPGPRLAAVARAEDAAFLGISERRITKRLSEEPASKDIGN